MQTTPKHILRSLPLFVFMLPVFFVFHGYMINYDFIPVKDSLLLLGIYFIAAIVLFLIGWLIYRHLIKAALFSTIFLGFHFFFGTLHDSLKHIFGTGIPSRYVFVLPVCFILLLTACLVLKKRKSGFTRTVYYLNLLFFLLIGLDLVMLIIKLPAKKQATAIPAGMTACDTCDRPDIYFILLDEYAGNEELKDIFNYNNDAFVSALSARGFQTASHTNSNYNYTPFSLASILNMDYLQLHDQRRGQNDLSYCYEKIRSSSVLQFLQSQGYHFYNHSIFDFEGQPKHVLETFLPSKTRLITSQTFLSRFDRDLRFNLLTKLNFKSDERLLTYANLHNNEKIISLTNSVAADKTKYPKFIYTHLMMPHYPYYYDSTGKELPYEKITEGNQVNQHDYIGYLAWSNKKILELVDKIKTSSSKLPIIILLGDHGFRHFEKPVDNKYYFLNFCAVYDPKAERPVIRDSTTTVNFFRQLFNYRFNQHLQLLKDTTIYLQD